MNTEKTIAPSATQQKIDRARLVNCRPAQKPPIMAACRNCKHFSYDASDRMGAKGPIVEKVGKFCTLNKFKTTSNVVCDGHEFRHADHRDI
ncbi:hypothetical protein BA896_021885 [Janthinobacterium lividum]|uniref:Uncharacterized protein n=1 Tax=Janthinobacterium lividum TaxID=29581 RepID=A0A1E8PKJ8_9BURK|nr:hypothetical protein BA896_021885 [Janthinobacterium lividum]